VVVGSGIGVSNRLFISAKPTTLNPNPPCGHMLPKTGAYFCLTKPSRNGNPLIAEFEKSGLSQAAFCRQHSLNAKYFSLKRSKLLNSNSSNTPQFVRVDNLSQPSPKSPLIHLHFGSVEYNEYKDAHSKFAKHNTLWQH
jgi:hypothetical protein